MRHAGSVMTSLRGVVVLLPCCCTLRLHQRLQQLLPILLCVCVRARAHVCLSVCMRVVCVCVRMCVCVCT